MKINLYVDVAKLNLGVIVADTNGKIYECKTFHPYKGYVKTKDKLRDHAYESYLFWDVLNDILNLRSYHCKCFDELGGIYFEMPYFSQSAVASHSIGMVWATCVGKKLNINYVHPLDTKAFYFGKKKTAKGLVKPAMRMEYPTLRLGEHTADAALLMYYVMNCKKPKLVNIKQILEE